MALNIEGCETLITEAVKEFWRVRDAEGVRGGKTLDGFIRLLTWVVHHNGLPNAKIITGRQAQLPGYFRPTKASKSRKSSKRKLENYSKRNENSSKNNIIVVNKRIEQKPLKKIKDFIDIDMDMDTTINP